MKADNDSTYLIILFLRLNMIIEYLAECPAQGNCPIHVSYLLVILFLLLSTL
jgi:hypothetical protein